MAAKTLDAASLAVLRESVVTGRVQHTATEVKSWGRDNGFKVNDGRGRMALELVDAFNTAKSKGKRKGQYVLRSVAQTPREYAYTTAKGRAGKFTATPAAIRAFALDAGLTKATKGRLGQDIVDAYGQALRAKA